MEALETPCGVFGLALVSLVVCSHLLHMLATPSLDIELRKQVLLFKLAFPSDVM